MAIQRESGYKHGTKNASHDGSERGKHNNPKKGNDETCPQNITQESKNYNQTCSDKDTQVPHSQNLVFLGELMKKRYPGLSLE
jgi:hypothetical protein